MGDADEVGVHLLVDRVGSDKDARGDRDRGRVARDVRYVKYQDIERAVIEVEFREPPTAEIAMLEQEEGSR